ncbi:MAG: sugar ABC transporter ATP-binding protein [Spirochaetota bacterium]
MIQETIPVLEIKNFKKEYPGIKALQEVSVSFNPREIHGLVGENGAGKSTLIKILAGVVKADAGEVYIRGKKAELSSGRDSRRSGLSFIHQELNLIDFFNAPENIFLGHPYPNTSIGTISWKSLHAKARSILDKLKVEIPLNVPVGRLSTVNRSMVAIARAFAESASIYFMDEPTTALTDNEKSRFFSVIQNLKEMGATVIYVSHHLDEILSITDRVTVLRDGRVVGTQKTAELDKAGLIRMMIGRDIDSAFPGKKDGAGITGLRNRSVLNVERLSGNKIKNVSFTLHKGEILGIAGLVGSGRSELLKLLYGTASITGGRIELDNRRYFHSSPRESIKNGIVYVPEERRAQGLVPNRSIYENITLVHLNKLSWGPFLNHSRNRIESEKIGKSVKLRTSNYNNPVKTLSGGNQQKVVFAKYLLYKPLVIMLDEPTRGVDIGARYEIYSVIRDLAGQGAAILLASSDFTELLGLSDRLLVLHAGRQTKLLDNVDLNEEKVFSLCYGRN